MQSTNGYGPRKAILYACVSTKTALGWLYDSESVEAFAEREKKRKED